MIEYITKLKKEEFLKFKEFIYSPYFNSNINIIKLFEYIISLYPDIKKDDFTKTKLSHHVFSENKVNDLKVRKLVSDFSILFEKFLIQLEVEANDIGNRIYLLGSLRRRGMTKRLHTEMKELYNSQKSKFSRDGTYYLNQMNLESEYFMHNFSRFKLKFAECLQRRSECLDYYFIFSKLHNFHEMSFNSVSKKKTFNKTYFTEIMNHIENNRNDILKNHPNIFIIYLVLKMEETLDDKYLVELLDYLKKNERKFTKESLSYYYHYVRAYYTIKINMGQSDYREYAFDIIKLMDSKKLFLIDNIITDMEYNSVINIALALKEYQWLEDFMEVYKTYLDPVFSKDAYNLAKAKLLYEKKEYEKINDHLNEVEFKDPTYYYNSKFILGRVNYEMRNINGLKYIINNLSQYLRTKKILNAEQSNAIKTFNKYMSELIKILESHSSEKKSLKVILKRELDDEKSIVSNKKWFYDKLGESI
jgi:hypothetical protein